MAKKTSKGNGTSRVRFIMLEAEMPEGDLAQITTAIQNALRPAPGNGLRVSRSSTQMIGSSELEEDDDVIDASINADDDASDNPAPKSGASKSRRPAKRKVVDIDLDSEMSLVSYVDRYPQKTSRIGILYL